MIARLFPDEVVTVSTGEESSQGQLLPSEEALILRAVRKRRQEFTAGRLCSRKALSRLGITNFPLLAAADRSPIWPEGIVGSISHCEGFCGVAVARQGLIVSLGLDVEVSEALQMDIVPLVCRPAEVDPVNNLTSLEARIHHKLIMSAKESIYKCYYQLARTMLDFLDLEVQLNPEAKRFTGKLVRADLPSARGTRLFHGLYDFNDRHVFTGVTLTSSEVEC